MIKRHELKIKEAENMKASRIIQNLAEDLFNNEIYFQKAKLNLISRYFFFLYQISSCQVHEKFGLWI